MILNRVEMLVMLTTWFLTGVCLEVVASHKLDSYNSDSPGDAVSMSSPRIDFEQWKPLTGRGDPLRNDPTYDYEPPVLERVHYWADDTRLEREHHPERKSEVLMLGVSSRRPSVAQRQQPMPPRRHHRLPPPKYEDFTYKLSEHYPMTILVPPPPPPPGGHPTTLFILREEITPNQVKVTERPTSLVSDTTPVSQLETHGLYALQEANLILQSSTTSQNWILDLNHTKPSSNTVSSDYAGWGPTTPIDDKDSVNETHNLILNDHIELSKHPYSFYKPMLSEAPPPPQMTTNPLLLPTFLPTALPPIEPTKPAAPISLPLENKPDFTTVEVFTATVQDYDETSTERQTTQFQQTPSILNRLPEKNVFDMLGPMMSMPLGSGPERLEDNLYAHASENLHIFKDIPEDPEQLETMQPPPVEKSTESPTISHKPLFPSSHIQQTMHKLPTAFTHDPYLHMRFTTPKPSEDTKTTTEAANIPMYLIIQGHSKVKTYGSKPKLPEDKETITNEILKPNETNEVKHLHPSKEKYSKKTEKIDNSKRAGRAHNLKSLIDDGLGSIEIQETDIGIKYDVSDGSEVPVEIYRKGIVDSDENDYSSKEKSGKRGKRQVDIDDILPFDEDKLEEYLYDFLKGRRNETGITGLIAQAVTSDAADVVDELQDDDEDDEHDDENR